MVVQREQDYFVVHASKKLMESTTTPTFSVTDTGFLLSVDSINYAMEWVRGMLHVTGPDICYYLVETARGLEQANCALTTFTVIMGN